MTHESRIVLILVVMEYGRWDDSISSLIEWYKNSLNPCCNGIWSVGDHPVDEKILELLVLILVVMEYGRWEDLKKEKK